MNKFLYVTNGLRMWDDKSSNVTEMLSHHSTKYLPYAQPRHSEQYCIIYSCLINKCINYGHFGSHGQGPQT